MGTQWSARWVAEAGTPSATAVAGAIEGRLATLLAALSHWEPRSALCRFNRAPAETWVRVPADLAAVIGPALALASASGGAFDPAIGRLVDLWGFGPPGPQPAPDDAMVAAARAAGGAARLRWDAAARRLWQPGGTALDLSGIAKGHAVDALGATLASLGLHHWLVEIGGELRGAGIKPDGEPWWVELEAPPGPVAPPPLRVALHGLAAATSGSYVRGDHTLDPRTGRPTTSGVRAASVLHDTALLADGWATILSVLRPAEGLALAAGAGIAARLLTGSEEHLSPALSAMLGD